MCGGNTKETSVDCKAFEYKYSNNPQRAFENFAYCLFCYEFNQKNGIFRYFNQPHIETNPIQVDDKLIGFQAKYVPFGEDRVIVTYLFANTSWRKDVHKCDLLFQERAAFFTDFVEKSRSVKAVFYALAKLLNTVGMEMRLELSGYIN